jgi:hypothetical protein
MSAFWLNFSSETKWTARIQAAHKIFKLWAVQGLNVFPLLLKLLLQKVRLALSFLPVYFYRLLGLLASSSPPVSVPIFPALCGSLFIFI